MKEKIDQFSKGIFIYNNPDLELSETNLDITVQSGKRYTGSFTVRNTEGTKVKGMVYSSDNAITFENDCFDNTVNEIIYYFNAEYMEANHLVSGKICVITDCGEAELPFYVKLKMPACETSVGPISDLFHFTNLAMNNWIEAKKLFKSEEFHKLLRYYNSKHITLYEHLVSGSNTSQALEEFLIAVRKKKVIELSVNRMHLNYEVSEYSFTDKIIISKDSLGYIQVHIKSDSAFVEPEKTILWTENFIGNSVELDVIIKPECMRAGRNYANIVISTPWQELKVPVVCIKAHNESRDINSRRKRRQYQNKLLVDYLSMRTNRLSVNKYIVSTDNLLTVLRTFKDHDIYLDLIKVFLHITAAKENMARIALNLIKEDFGQYDEDNIVYGSLQFFEGILSKNSGVVTDRLNSLRTLYNRDSRFIFMWYIYQLDKKYRVNKQAAYDILKKQFTEYNTISPILHLEACSVLNDDPTVIKEISSFELQVVRFGLHYDIISKNAILQFTYLCSKEKKKNVLLRRVLEKAFEKHKMSELLEALCTYYVVNDCRDEEAYKVLCGGIGEQLRVNGIYEQCVMAAGEENKEPFPKQVFNYFDAGIESGDDSKAVLYANVIKYRDRNESVYQQFYIRMTEFTKEQLMEGRIDSNRALLYNKLLNVQDVDEKTAMKLPDILFKYYIRNLPQSITEVCVVHRGLYDEVKFQVINNTAYIDIFTEDHEVFLLDDKGNRYSTSFDIKPVQMISRNDLIERCSEMQIEDKRLLFNRLEDTQYGKSNKDLINIIRKVADIQGLTKSFAVECEKKLIEYYYENLEGELMESHLVLIDFSYLNEKERIRMLEYMILRELYNLALKKMEIYGYEGVDLKRLLKLCTRLIPGIEPKNSTDFFKKLCFYVFKHGKYNDVLLSFLNLTYNGETESMYDVWKTACGFEIDSTDIEERLLAQLLFTESDMSYAKEVFRYYYNHGCTRKLIRAFLSYYSYGYLIYDRQLEKELFNIIKRELNYEENDVCMLALLKFYSEQDYFIDSDRIFIECQLCRMEQKGLILPYFQKFKGKAAIPSNMYDKYYVEYHTDPHKRVKIYYNFDGGITNEGYVTEDMYDVCYGIFVKEFILFYGESLQYYISEEGADGNSITESRDIRLEPELIGNEETKYHQLNLIITAREMNDDKTLIKMLESYISNDFKSNILFKPL